MSDLGLSHPRYVRVARTHSSVAAAVAAGWADVGFGEREAAEEAGLSFKFLSFDELDLLISIPMLNHEKINLFLEAIKL